MDRTPPEPAPPPERHEPLPRLAVQRLRATRGGTRQVPADRLVLVHGFTQTSACWAPVDAALGVDHDLVLVDAPGHGASSGVELDLAGGGEAIAEVGGPGTYVGYSMGGRFVLHAALARPDAVRRLVLVSATAGIEDDDERDARRRSDEALADHLVDVGVEAFLDEWLARPMFAGLPEEAAHLRARRANSAEGLASSLRLAGTGTQAPLWHRLAELRVPVLVVAGADDPPYRALGQRLASEIGPNAELAVVEGAGHTVHLEQPDRFLARLLPWLDATRTGSPNLR